MSEVPKRAFPHTIEVLKIIEGALASDKLKVSSYAEQLANRLEAVGDETVAARIRRILKSAEKSNGAARQSGLHTAKIPVDSEARLGLADESFWLPEEVRVFCEPFVDIQVDEFLGFVHAADRLIAGGVGISPTLLLYGLPGCGKSELAKSIAAKLGLPLLTARADALISSYLGSTAKNIRLLFEHVQSRPCVLFLDELDALAKLRDDQHELGELKRVVISLLQNIDKLDNSTVLVAATNHQHLLDPAVWRRFAFKIELKRPLAPVRKELFAHFLAHKADEEACAAFAQITDGLTGADIRQLSEDCIRSAIVQGLTSVQPVHVFRRILGLPLNLTHDLVPVEELKLAARKARNLDKKVFTYKVLESLVDTPDSTISDWLKESDDVE